MIWDLYKRAWSTGFEQSEKLSQRAKQESFVACNATIRERLRVVELKSAEGVYKRAWSTGFERNTKEAKNGRTWRIKV